MATSKTPVTRDESARRVPLQADGDVVGSIYPLTLTEVAFGVGAVLAWMVLFAAGAVVGTAFYRGVIGGTEQGSLAVAWFAVITCYTPTNVGLLAFLAGLAGEFSDRSKQSQLAVLKGEIVDPRFRDVVACYAAGAMRGFVVYLLIVSGLLLVTSDAIADPDQGQYVRLAGLISVLSFVAGYDSEVFKAALDRIVQLVSQKHFRSVDGAREADDNPLRKKSR